MDGRLPPDFWFRLLCALPWLTLGCVYLEALLAALTLGHWPVPSLDDPKDLLTAPLHIVSTLFVLTICPGPLVLGLVVGRDWAAFRRPSRSWRWLGFFLLGYLFLAASMSIDPGRVWYWWAD